MKLLIRTFLFIILCISVAEPHLEAAGRCPYENIDTTASFLSIKQNTTVVKKYNLFELDIKVDADYVNPFDYEDIRIEAEFISPQKEVSKVEGFVYSVKVAGRSNKVRGKEVVDVLWKVRFAPSEAGIWEYNLKLVTSKGHILSQTKEFEALDSLNPGYIQISKMDNKYFEFNNGQFYYPVGENTSWASINNYRKYFKSLSEAGGNWGRVWMSSWEVALEWTGGRYEGLGYYNLKAAKKLDKIVGLAKENNLYLQLVFNHHGQLSTNVNPQWEENPYNAKNGGPCEKPQDFFTSPEARRLYKNRMRYIVARWGYSPNILCWEMWNELTYVDNLTPEVEVSWHKEMAAYVKKIDNNRHLVSTSYAGSFYERSFNEELWKLEDMDFTQFHMYNPDIVQVINGAWRAMRVFDKPYIMAEIGTGSADGVDEKDKEARYLHSAIWAQFMTPASGNAMCWWWDTYIHPNNLYYQWKALTNYAGNLDRRLKNLRLSIVKLKAKADADETDIYAQGILNNQEAYIWVYDLDETRFDPSLNKDNIISQAHLAIEGMDAGVYVVEFWDTYSGMIIDAEKVISLDGIIIIDLPEFKRDMALKVLSRQMHSLSKQESRLVDKSEKKETIKKEAVKASKIKHIIIDGQVKDWKLKQVHKLSLDSNSGYFVQKGQINSDSDFSAEVYFSYDEENLYVLADVKDDSVLSRQKGIDVWRDDCLELWIDAENNATEFNNMPFNPGCFQVNIAPKFDNNKAEVYVYRNFNITDLKENIKAASSITDKGYIIEAAIPFEYLGIKSEEKITLGFNVSFVDRDKEENKWNHILLYGKEEEDATDWGDLTL